MGFCEHCEGQRLDRARVLRVLRATRKRLGESVKSRSADKALVMAIEAVRALDIPHLELLDEFVGDEVIH